MERFAFVDYQKSRVQAHRTQEAMNPVFEEYLHEDVEDELWFSRLGHCCGAEHGKFFRRWVSS